MEKQSNPPPPIGVRPLATPGPFLKPEGIVPREGLARRVVCEKLRPQGDAPTTRPRPSNKRRGTKDRLKECLEENAPVTFFTELANVIKEVGAEYGYGLYKHKVFREASAILTAIKCYIEVITEEYYDERARDA